MNVASYNYTTRKQTKRKGGNSMKEEIGASNSKIRCARTLEVIETEELVGKGTLESPHYLERRYWDFDGRLLAIGVLDG